MTEQEKQIYNQAKDIAEQITKILDRQKTPHHITLTALGYAMAMILQGHAIAIKKDPMQEVVDFAKFMALAAATFKPAKPEAES